MRAKVDLFPPDRRPTRTPPTFGRRRRRDAQWVLGRALLAVAGALPDAGGRAIGRQLGAAFGRASPARTERAVATIRARLDVDTVEAKRIARAMWRELGQIGFEAAVAPRLAARGDAYVELSSADRQRLLALRDRAGGLIVASGHVGSWELMAARLASELSPALVFVRGPADPRWADWLNARRRALGLVTAERGGSAWPLRALRRAADLGLGDPPTVGFLVDQATRVPCVPVPFFGVPAPTPTAPARLHARTGWPVVVATAARRADGGHRVQIDPLDQVAAPELPSAINAALERRIRARSEAWIWFHDRWRDPG